MHTIHCIKESKKERRCFYIYFRRTFAFKLNARVARVEKKTMPGYIF